MGVPCYRRSGTLDNPNCSMHSRSLLSVADPGISKSGAHSKHSKFTLWQYTHASSIGSSFLIVFKELSISDIKLYCVCWIYLPWHWNLIFYVTIIQNESNLSDNMSTYSKLLSTSIISISSCLRLCSHLKKKCYELVINTTWVWKHVFSRLICDKSTKRSDKSTYKCDKTT